MKPVSYDKWHRIALAASKGQCGRERLRRSTVKHSIRLRVEAVIDDVNNDGKLIERALSSQPCIEVRWRSTKAQCPGAVPGLMGELTTVVDADGNVIGCTCYRADRRG